MSVATEFKEFILRGNVVDLAVGVVIGAAFGTVVKSFTAGFITPLIGIFGKVADFATLSFSINGSKFLYGAFINDVITFLLTAAVVFFFVVKPVNWLMSRAKSAPPEPETTRDCPECLSKIPIAATRCAFCTATVASGATA